MADQILRLGEAGAERELSLVGRTFRRLPIEQSSEVKTVRGSLSTYYGAIKDKATFEITFNQLPGKDSETVDGKTGRDNLLLERRKFTTLRLLILPEDGFPIERFNVKFIRYDDDYNRPVGVRGHGGTVNTWRYDIIMTLQEV